MKSIASFIATLCLAALSNNAFSAGQWQTSWKGVGPISNGNFIIAAKVLHYNNNKTITFILEDEDRKDCHLAGTMLYRSIETVIYVEDQGIRAIGKCFEDNGTVIYNFTPKSEAGRKYVVSLFRVMTAPASIGIDHVTFQLPTNGFTSVWNSVSDEVL